MQEGIFHADKLPEQQQSTSHPRSIQLATAMLPVLIIGIVVGSLAGLQWAGWRGITLGYPQPQVQIVALPTGTLIRNQSYQFAAAASGRDLSYSWDFGDQRTASGASVTHTYESNNTYAVVVTVTDPAGHQASQSTTVAVVPPKPQAFFTSSVDEFGDIFFDASHSSADPSTSIASYNWDFGDGSTPDNTTFPEDSHFYSNLGTYQVTLTVIDATGQASNPYTATVTIS